ncbi:MAG: SdrD B-like domain-containing protein [Saprospiraceae bacterium]
MKLCTLSLIFLGPIFCLEASRYYSFCAEPTGSACSLNIDRVLVGDCEYGSRTAYKSKVIVAVFISWKSPVPNEKIQVKLNGMTKLFDPFEKACPPYVQFILDPDGSALQVDAAFVQGNCSATSVNIQLPLPCDPPVCSGPQSIGGKLFFDYNNNGKQESSEIGLSDIDVNLYDDAKLLHASTKTKTNGLWAVNNLTAGQKLRVEYQIPSNLFDANPGTENKTRTQIATVGDCGVNLGIYQLKSVIDANPWIATTLFIKGDAQNPLSRSYTDPTIVLNLYNTTEGGPRLGPNGSYYLASGGETGSIWGMCFQKESRKLISGAFLKRNAALGPGGLGAIYVTDLTNFLPSPTPSPNYKYFGRTTMLLNLDSFGINTGDETTLIRNLPIDPNQASHDSISFDKIGKIGLGDLDFNDAGDTLFAVNMFKRSLVVIAVGNPMILPITPDRVSEIPIPDPGCSNKNDWRPWGLKYHDGQLYVGGVCSAETTNKNSDLFATIYTYTTGLFNKLTSFELGYTKGYLNDNYCSTFQPWRFSFYGYYVSNDVTCGPSPVLSDIEFDSEGNMIVAIGDRYGYQTGGRDYGTNTKDNLRYLTFSGGDNLKFFKLKNEFLLEQNASSGFYTTNGQNNKQGVCGGEFYYQDGFFSHQEGALGALAVHPSYNTVLSTMMDPASVWSNGWSQLDNSLGTKNVNYNIFSGETGTFGKSAGLGDIELLIGSSTPNGIGVSIGNYIWNDLDQDGLQDPGEPAIPNVLVLLYNSKDSLIQQTKTDLSGLYYFKNLNPTTEYYIQLGADTNYINKDLVLNNTAYRVTKFNSRTNFGNAENDSDASLNLPIPTFYKDKIAYYYLTGRDGENNFSLDFGLLTCDQIVHDTVKYNLCLSDSVKVGAFWFSVNNPNGRVNFPNAQGYACDSVVFVSTNFYSPSTFVLDTSICVNSSLTLHNQVFDLNNSSGSILLSGANQYSCDSILEVRVHFLAIPESTLDTSCCIAGKVVLHNQIFDINKTSGHILLSGQSQFACDSIINVNLTILPFSKSNLDTMMCPGSFLMIHNQRFDEANLANDVVLSNANQFGCDSVISVRVSLLPITNSRLDTSMCPGSFLMILNQRFDDVRLNGNIVLSQANQWACDSIVQVKVNLLPTSSSHLDTTICLGDYVLLHNQRFDENKTSGRIVLTGSNPFGCDSIVDVNLHFRPLATSRFDTSMCPGGNVTIHQTVFNEQKKSAQILLSAANQFGCDSIVNVNLRIPPQYHILDTIESCVEYTWPVTGLNYRSSGTYRLDTVTREGCDSTYQMQLIIHPEFHITDTICKLDHFLWSSSGVDYTKSGVYAFNYNSFAGCDSVRYLFLVVASAGQVFVPNVFSPNGDQVNDRLFVFANEDVHQIDLFAIYDRWGELVFKQNKILPNDSVYGWDGIFRNQLANPAVFVYVVEWHDKIGGFHQAKGDVTLLR